MNRTPLFLVRVLASSCMLFAPRAALPADNQPAGEFPHTVSFELGEAEFAPGDSITIQAVRGTQAALAAGQTYCVTGTYTLSSQPEADLSFFVTTTNAIATPIDPRQTVRVQKGSGTFTLAKTMDQPGHPHLSFYPAQGGSAFGGVYFGQGAWVLHQKGFSYLDSSTGASEPHAPRLDGPGNAGSLPDQNRRILEYLGSPVSPPANLDPAYTKEGLIAAIGLAARKASISLKRVEIDDSEFPFVVGLICAEADYARLVDQIKKMPTYEAQGGVSSKTCYAINLTPWRVFPAESLQRIGRRLGVREEMFYDKLSRQQ